MKKRIFLFVLLLNGLFVLNAQEGNQLEQYVQQGLKSNLVVQQRSISLDNAVNALKQARNLYIPTFDFQAMYTTAQGGRSYEMPIGDFLNPIFNTVNDMLGTTLLPQVENEKINFLPKNYYDARFRLSVPILNMDIIHNMHITDKQRAIKENELEIYERELVKEIKVTYYLYLSSMKAEQIYQNTLEMAEEAKRVNEKLVDAGNGLHAYVLRSESEMEQIKTQLKTAELQSNSLRRYFNALLNRGEMDEIVVEDSESIIPFVESTTVSAKNREELNSLDLAVALREDVVKMKKHAFVPTLGGFLDLGSQAEEFRFNKNSIYYMVGVQLNIPIFQGNRNNLKIKEAKNEMEIAKLQKEYVEQQLAVSVNKAYSDVLIEKSKYESTLKQLDMAETYYRLITKGYASGVNTYLETVDARSQLSSAKLAANIGYYQFLSALAKLERESASYPLNN
ncbi:MAG: TolC family protein [Crocinitomicaceae bacterium]|nr:TolC family protein [Crocinitomicaceae bacterium]